MPSPIYNLQGIQPTPPKNLQGVFGEQERPEEDFIKLMVAQLQNQDPDKPVEGTQLISQLMQMNAAVATQRMAWISQENHLVTTAAALLGREVLVKDAKTGAMLRGKVSTVDYDGQRPSVVVNGQHFPVESVTRVDA